MVKQQICFYISAIYIRFVTDFHIKMEVKQSVKFSLFSKVISTLIKKYITNTINETILKKKGSFVIAFRARAPPSCSTTACDVTGLVCSVGQLSNI